MISEKESYTKEDLDECLETVMEAISIMNNKPLMDMVKKHAKEQGQKIAAIKEFSQDNEEGKITSIEDLRKKRYKAFKEKSNPDYKENEKEEED